MPKNARIFLLRKKNPSITIIGWSAAYQANGGDINLDKTEKIAQIGKIINDL